MAYIRKPKVKNYMDETTYSTDSSVNNSEGAPQVELSLKALRDLPKSAYSFLADPYTASLPASNPYAILAMFNKKVGGGYAGNRNLDGGNVAQYANSNRSGFLRCFDFARLPIIVNYRYINSLLQSGIPTTVGPDSPYTGSGLIDQQRQAISEACSTLQATTFTQMAINSYAIRTDMPMGSAKRKQIGGKYYYTDLADVIYAIARYYQITLQDAILVVNNYNSFRVKQGTMIRSSWNRETPALNSLFGILNKKTFLNLIDSMCLSIQGEYIDTEWVQQVNMLSMMPSRKSNAMTDPVKEVCVRHEHPHYFEMVILNDNKTAVIGEPVYVDATENTDQSLQTGVGDAQLKVFNGQHSFKYEHLITILDELGELFSAENTMVWARSAEPEDDTARFNKCKWRLDALTKFMTKFKIAFNDFREVLDVLCRTGLNTWRKNFRPAVTKDTDAQLFDNLLVDDIYKVVLSGAPSIKFDDTTKRWRFHTIWNMYDGIPEFDANSGGAFISFSAKSIDTTLDSDDNFSYIPKAFDKAGLEKMTWIPEDTEHSIPAHWALVRPSICTMNIVNRVGTELKVQAVEVTVHGNIVLERLAPLTSQASLQLRIPSVTDYTNVTDMEKSHIYSTLVKEFGYCKTASNAYLLDPDIVALYQIEIEDVTNNAIKYARINGPFKGSYSEADDLGFSKFGQR